MFKSLLLAAAAAVTVAMPATAKVDPGTQQLLLTLSQHINVKINSNDCNIGPKHFGSWDPNNLTMVLCTHGEVDAEDHDTVRHEAWHVVQHCLTPKGSRLVDPVFTGQEYQDVILARITNAQLQRLMTIYPPSHHASEVEAFVVAAHVDAAAIEQAFLDACVNP